MRILIAAMAFAASAAVAGDFVYTRGADFVVLTMAPCELPLPQKDVMLAARASVGGHDFVACWAPINKEFFAVVYSDGDTAALRFSALRPLTDI